MMLTASAASAQSAPDEREGTPATAQASSSTVPSQGAPGGPTSNVAPDPSQNGVIVVTAQKRAENVQDVPLAVQVIQPSLLNAAGVTQFQELDKVAPSLVVRPANHPANANISIRGVGTFAFGIGVEPSVAVLVDEVPLSFQARAFTDLPDVERVEVLRGPQSTLYGKSASAGLINIITRDPTDTLRVRGNALVTTDDEYGINASVSGPINDTLGFIVSGSYSEFEGNVRNVFLDRDQNGRESVNLRGKLRWRPIDGASMTLSGNYVDGSTTVGAPYVTLDPDARFLGIPSLTPELAFPGVTPGPDNQEVAENFLSRTDYKGGGANLRTEVELGEMSLISITSFDDYTLKDFTDQDTTVGNNVEEGIFRSHLVTQEVRLLSPADRPLRYTLGGYYARSRFERPFFRGPAFIQANWFATSASRQLAAYAQFDYNPIEALTLTAGGRVQDERFSYTYEDLRANTFFAGDADDTAFTYKLSARYEFTPDVSAFATFATGYKGQTFDLTTGFDATRQALGPIRPETSEGLEIGVRSQFFDRRVTLNLTYFDTQFDDLQAQTIETVGIEQFYRLTNVGGLSTKGVELEANAGIGDDLNLLAAVTYLDAEYSEFEAAPCYPGQTVAQGCSGSPGRQNLTGARSAQSPEWRLTANADYSPRITDDLRGVLQANWRYQSDINLGTLQDPQLAQDAFSIVNLAAGVRDEERRWEIVAFVNNVFDKQYFAARLNQNPFFSGATATLAFLPRDFRRYGGLRLSVNY